MFHKELGEINLSELNLDDLEDRRLCESLYGKTKKGDLECLDRRRRDPGCPQWMSFFDVATDRVTVREAKRARPPGC
ncbi:hypothetical protein [Streptomyces sp. NRRL S-378]|uniref:hypothetical protein n=1 Tax=Streptomyces sp. NRRL S-378 TaxID=1463904 RepID=UPI000AC132A7|nr:hypothetical protein [Streptomyces sp. NRRL S-378]